MSTETTVTRAELEQSIVDQAAVNAEYRKQLLANPRAMIERHIGQKLPENLQVDVVQESANKVIIRLPYSVAAGSELQEDDLEQVAGGKGSQDKITCIGAGATAGAFVSKNEVSAV